MKTIFCLKSMFANNLPIFLKDEESIKRAINLREIQNYSKLILFEKDDYVTCCENKDSVKKSVFHQTRKGLGFRFGRTFKVKTSVMISRNSYVVFDEEGKSVYSESLRKATDEEIKTFLKSKTYQMDMIEELFNLEYND